MLMQMRDEEIGGAIVRRTFTTSGKKVFPGAQLSREQVLSFPILNRMALATKRYIELVPKNPEGMGVGEKPQRFVVSAGFGRFHVIEGRKINDEALDRDMAYALAGVAAPPPVQRRKKVA